MEDANSLRRSLDHNILIFYCVFPRLGSRGPLSSASSAGSGTSAGSVNSGSSARPAQEPSGAKKIEKVDDFDAAYVRFGSGPPVSRRRDESRGHQVCIFIDQSAARTSGVGTVGALIQPRENPYAASSVWGITNYVELAGHVFDLIKPIKCSLTVIG